jgi:hypothetical protein
MLQSTEKKDNKP